MASVEGEPSRKRSRSPTPPKVVESGSKAEGNGSPGRKKAALESTLAPALPASHHGVSAPSTSTVSATPRTLQVVDDEEAAFNAVDEETLIASSASAPSTSSTPAPTQGKGWQGGKSQKASGRKGRNEKQQEDGHPYRREWASRERPAGAGEGESDDKEARLPKYRTAVLLGYCGKGYSGMQIQFGGEKTIEGDLFEALAKAGAISSDNAVDSRKVDMQRAARTDAGVHAAGNVISLKLILHPPIPPEFPNLTAYVNSFLPPQIRMWGLVKCIKSFQARTSCDSRKYEYLLPSYCLLPPGKDDQLAKNLDASSPGWREGLGAAADFADAIITDTEGDGDMDAPPAETVGNGEGGKKAPSGRREFERRRGWRIDAETMTRFRALVEKFLGTRNFHNYTVGKAFSDRSVKRYMISIEVKDPQVYGDIEWVSVQIHGQSFMLHQIRKMMSMAMLACRTNSPPSIIPETFGEFAINSHAKAGPKCIHIPKAPPLGLLLEAPQFSTYNDLKLKSVGNPEDRERVDFAKYADEIHAFKVKYIYEALRQEELQTNIFHKWIRQVDCTPGNAFSFLNTKGVIPAEAVVHSQKGEQSKSQASAADSKSEKQEPGGGAAPTKGAQNEELESDDEGLDQEQLKRGELEG